ncbi:MAG: Gfo/Idh/MocA family protein [Candidatus Brocadiia bacterium]
MGRQHELSRRAFLGRASAALGFPYILSASTLGAAPSDRITMGIIGYGKQCRGHLGAMLGRREVQVLAVCDVQALRLGQAKARVDERYAAARARGAYRGCLATGDFRHVVARQDIQAALIATPDHWHAIPSIHACQAGKDVYCEKPLSLTLREARAMVDAARRYRRVFQTGSQQRSWNNFRFACEMVRSGRIGRVHTVHVNVGGPSRPCHLPGQPLRQGVDWDMWLGPAPWRPYHETICPPLTYRGWPQWRRFRDYSGGGMTDIGAHHFDIAQWGLGTDHTGPVEIVPPGHGDAPWLTYRYAHGVVMHHGGSPRSSIAFLGTEGKVFVGRGHLSTEPPELMHTPIQPGEVHLTRSDNHHANWLAAIRARSRPVADVEIGARSVSVCHLGNLAYGLRRPLRWDPQREVFPRDAEANRGLDRARRAPWRL